MFQILSIGMERQFRCQVRRTPERQINDTHLSCGDADNFSFPTQAFQESTEIARLQREPPQLVDMYVEPVPRADDDAEEEALIRTNIAHDWLQRLELNPIFDDLSIHG